MQNLREYFYQGRAAATKTGATWGVEVETHFVTAHEHTPISEWTARQILAVTPPGPWQLKPELGRQLLELAIEPQSSPEMLMLLTHRALDWLYRTARSYDAIPIHTPVLAWPGQLLLEPSNDADGERDRLFFELDGRPALEELCRIASIQFTVSVSPNDAIALINGLWASGLHQRDYPNDAYWKSYITGAAAGYDALRYGGPSCFTDLDDYVRQLALHPVVMNDHGVCNLPAETLGNDDKAIALFLRSVWWHYRIRRYDSTLAIEIRPLARREDIAIAECLNVVREILGF